MEIPMTRVSNPTITLRQVGFTLLAILGCGGVVEPAAPSTSSAPASGFEHVISALTALPRPVTWTATASVNSSTANNAVDASATTVWTTGTTTSNNQANASHWLRIDMKSRRTFVALTLNASTATTNYPRSYTVHVSNDGTNWGSAVATATGNTAVLTTITFAPQTAQYIRVTQNITAGVTNFWSVFDVQVYGTALSRTGWVLSASSGNTATETGRAIDGSTTTRWSSTSAANAQWFKIDMRSPQTFNQLVLDAGTTTNDFPRTYSIFVSNDDATWGTAVASGTGTTAFMVATFAFQRARYIRIDATRATTGSPPPWSIQEIDVEGQPTARTAQPRAGWVATASSSGGSTGPALAVDGSTTTRWRASVAQANNQYFQVEMLAARAIEELRLDAGSAMTEYPRSYKVQVSNDDVSWGTAPTVVTGTGTTAVTTITFPSRTARYVRVTLTGASSSFWSIYDFNVYASALTRPGWVATATAGSDVAARAIDGTTSTRWTTGTNQANNQYFQIDMLAPQVFNQLTLDAATSAGHDPDLPSLLVSNDGTNWGTAVSIATVTGTTSSSPTQLATTLTFPTQTARLFRIALTGAASPAANWSIHELNVWRIVGSCEGVTCPAPDQCHDPGTCNASTGLCSNPAKADGTACTDSNACTIGDRCQAGACLPISGTSCAGREDVTFYQSYDNDTTVDIATNGSTPQRIWPMVKVPGLFGGAIDGSTDFDLVYLTDTVRPTSIDFSRPGSVSVWLKPKTVGFSPPTVFMAFDTWSHHNFYLGANETTINADFVNGVTGQFIARASTPWTADERWHLIVVNWDRNSVAVSLDGGELNVAPAQGLQGIPTGPHPGSMIWAGGSGAGYSKDELMVLNRPLGRQEIHDYYELRNNPSLPNPALALFGPYDPGRHVSAVTQFEPPSSKTLRVQVDLSGLVSFDGLTSVGLQIVRASDQSVVDSTAITTWPNNMAQMDWLLPGLDASVASYILKVTLNGLGGHVGTFPFAYNPAPCPLPVPGDCRGPGTRNSANGACDYPPLPNWTTCSDGNFCNGIETCQNGVCTEEQAGAATTCAPDTQVTFYQSFNSGTTLVEIATGGQRTPNADNWTAPLFPAPGLFGGGIQSETEPWLSYRALDYANPPSVSFSKPGSASLWVKMNENYVPGQFFIAYSGYGYLSAGDSETGMWARLDSVRSITMPRPPSWRPDGQWHLVVVNWSLSGVAMIVDGVSSAVSPGLPPLAPTVLETANVVVAGGSGAGAVRDELLYLNRPLTSEEISWYYAQRLTASGSVNPAVARFDDDPAGCNAADDLNPCTVDSCDLVAGFVHSNVQAGTSCSDQNACNGIEVCNGLGTCVGGSPLVCNDGDVCTLDSCDRVAGCTVSPTTCTVRRGRIEAESFDAETAMTENFTDVTPGTAGASMEFADVDFGAAGTSGRFQVMLVGAQNDQHVELRLDSPTGPVVADLLTLASDQLHPAAQSTPLLTAVSGVHRVVIVALSTAVGSFDWFSLEPGIGQTTIADFSTDFRHPDSGHGLDLNNLPIVPAGEIDEEESDVPPMTWFSSSDSLDLAPGELRILAFTTVELLEVFGEARWLGSSGDVEITIIDSDAEVIATGGPSSIAGGGAARVSSAGVPPQTVGIRVKNVGLTHLMVEIRGGAVRRGGA
jgi:hypothetical protein